MTALASLFATITVDSAMEQWLGFSPLREYGSYLAFVLGFLYLENKLGGQSGDVETE